MSPGKSFGIVKVFPVRVLRNRLISFSKDRNAQKLLEKSCKFFNKILNSLINREGHCLSQFEMQIIELELSLYIIKASILEGNGNAHY